MGFFSPRYFITFNYVSEAMRKKWALVTHSKMKLLDVVSLLRSALAKNPQIVCTQSEAGNKKQIWNRSYICGFFIRCFSITWWHQFLSCILYSLYTLFHCCKVRSSSWLWKREHKCFYWQLLVKTEHWLRNDNCWLVFIVLYSKRFCQFCHFQIW